MIQAISGADWMRGLLGHMGIDPGQVARVIVDANAFDDPLAVYVLFVAGLEPEWLELPPQEVIRLHAIGEMETGPGAERAAALVARIRIDRSLQDDRR
jgi:hypothetical protein